MGGRWRARRDGGRLRGVSHRLLTEEDATKTEEYVSVIQRQLVYFTFFYYAYMWTLVPLSCLWLTSQVAVLERYELYE
jgi:hypothetical protein